MSSLFSLGNVLFLSIQTKGRANPLPMEETPQDDAASSELTFLTPCEPPDQGDRAPWDTKGLTPSCQ